jgi:putative peptidoglycan lipid II flippase
LAFQPLLLGVLLLSGIAAVIYAVLAGAGLKATGLLRLVR